jgi:hypothetical protein
MFSLTPNKMSCINHLLFTNFLKVSRCFAILKITEIRYEPCQSYDD